MTELERLRALKAAVERWFHSPLPRSKADHELMRAWAACEQGGRPTTRIERAHAGLCVDEEGG